VEAENPAHSVADSARMRQALRSLEFLVVIDVALSETAREAHYVLPSCSQYEKWEATFFGSPFTTETEFANTFTLRAPILEALPGTLPEGEIHRRLVRALGAMTDDDVAPLQAAAAKGREVFATELMRVVSERPRLAAVMTALLYETLGPTLGAGAENAASVWGIAHEFARRYPDSVRRAGIGGQDGELGEALFDAILKNRSGVVVSVDPFVETWRRIHKGKINLTIPELLPELRSLRDERQSPHPDFPFVLSAGQRRSSTANTIIRDPKWRPKDPEGALWMNPEDASHLGVKSGGRVRVITKRGSADTMVEVTDSMLPGHVSLPNGTGLWYPDREGQEFQNGVAPNDLTTTEDRDWFAGTPFHKHVRARIEAIAS
jgi:anaerobic selenocysteine-containing dehydrogenase